MPKVIVQFGGEEWPVELREGVNVAGRSPQAAIPIRDASMSREHCEFLLQGTVATVVDRGSMNGTLVNGTKMDRKVLVPGDKIQIGKAVIFFEDKGRSAPATPPPAAKAKAPAAAGIDDFSVWRKEGGSGVKIAVAVAILLLVGVGAAVFFKSLGGSTAVATDPGNLIGTSGRFDPGPDGTVSGWMVRTGLASKIQVVETAKQGKTSLQLDKSGAPQDFIAEVLSQEILAVPSSGGIEVSAWTMGEGSTVLPGLKVTWLGSKRGPIVLEAMSEPVAGSSSWTQLSRKFGAPPGAQFVQVSLIAAGRAGRVLFDDVRVAEASGGGAAKFVNLGPYSVGASTEGVLGIAQGESRRLVNNLQLILSSDKDGTTVQSAATGVRLEADGEGKKVVAGGKMASPVDLRALEFDIEARGGKDSVLLGCRVRGEALRQLDRVGVSFLLPGGELKGDYSKEVPKLWFRTTGVGDFIFDLSQGLMKVSADWVPEARRVAMTIPVPKGATELSFGLALKAGAGGILDPLVAADKAIAEGRMADAHAILKETLGETREEAKRIAIQNKIKSLEEIEAVDWQAVQSQHFMAELLGMKPYYESAAQKLDSYEKRWTGWRVEAGKAAREKMTAAQAGAAEDRETIRAYRLLARGEELLLEGRKTLARELFTAVKRHYSQTSAAEKAAELLKKTGTE
jgi:hypothetical protein